MSGAVVHIIGQSVQVGPLRRQRCSWCGHLLKDEDLSRIAWALDEDGTDPGPPPMWPVGDLVAIWGDADSYRAMRVIPEDEWPDSAEPGEKRLPDNCCAQLDPEVTR